MHTKKTAKKTGFTLIEMLIVVFLISLVVIALVMITKGLIMTSNRLKKLQVARAQAQEAIHFFTKELRMSELTNAESDKITFNWRKKDGYSYIEEEVVLNKGAVESFFEGSKIENLRFVATGNSGEFICAGSSTCNNRVTMAFDIIIENIPEDITIPFQTTVSLRSYKLQN